MSENQTFSGVFRGIEMEHWVKMSYWFSNELKIKCISDFVINYLENSEAIPWGVLCKKVFLEILQNSQENTFARVSFLITLQACLRSPEFCEISKNTFFTEHIWATVSRNCKDSGKDEQKRHDFGTIFFISKFLKLLEIYK